MIKFEGIDLTKIVNIYPSVVVKHQEEVTTISFEWYDENNHNVQKMGYALILIDNDGEKRELFYNSYEELLGAMEEISKLLG